MSKAFFRDVCIAIVMLVITGCSDSVCSKRKVAGTWKAKDYNWEFTFDSKAELVKIHHSIGVNIDVKEGGVALKGENASGVVILGAHEGRFDEEICELFVDVELDYFRLDMPIGTLEGMAHDKIWGVLTEEGENIFWTGKWYNYGSLKGGNVPDPESIEPVDIVLYKVSD